MSQVRADNLEGEDEGTIRDHAEFMKKEWSKSAPDINGIDDRMQWTFGARQDIIHTADVDVVLNEYSALGSEKQACTLYHDLFVLYIVPNVSATLYDLEAQCRLSLQQWSSCFI